MKKILVLLSSMLCLVTAPNANAYQQYSEQCVGQCTNPCKDPCVGQCEPSCGRIYVGAFGGANWLKNQRIDGIRLKTKTGFAGGLSLGYKFDNGFRVEGEVAYRRNKLDTKHFAKESYQESKKQKFGGNFHTWSYMANFLYDFENVSCYLPNVVPYVGFGVGYADSQRKEKSHKDSDNYSSSDKDSHKHNHKGFAYQGIAGVGYNLTESTTLAVEYRYFNGGKHVKDHGLCLAVRQSF